MYTYVKGKGWVLGPVVPTFVLYHNDKHALLYVKDVPENVKRSPCGQKREDTLEAELLARAASISDDYYIGPRFNAHNAVCAVYLKDLCTPT